MIAKLERDQHAAAIRELGPELGRLDDDPLLGLGADGVALLRR